MSSYDAQNRGQTVPNTMTSMYVERLATHRSAPNLTGGQGQATSSFEADLQSAATGYTQGALTHDSESQGLFRHSYEQNGHQIPSYNQ